MLALIRKSARDGTPHHVLQSATDHRLDRDKSSCWAICALTWTHLVALDDIQPLVPAAAYDRRDELPVLLSLADDCWVIVLLV